MALERAAFAELESWKKSPRRKALLVTGARQVGKTYLVREFARRNYQVFLEINFVETPSAKAIFEGDLNAETLIANLTAFSGMALEPGSTLIFFDEVQECPRARTAIKFLVDDGRFDYIESGSLLGVLYNEVPSLPVGYEQVLRMYPLSLEEFFVENGVQQTTLDLARSCCEESKPVPPVVHERLMRLFRLYLAVGGMPAAVQEFVSTSDLARVLGVQRDILTLYRQDIAKYAPNKAHVHAIFDAIPAELNKKNKRFKLSDLAKTARMERYESDFMWLADAGVALPCYNAVAPQVPLEVNVRHNLFKLFFCDVGLLSAASVGAVQFDLVQGDLSVNWGSFLENVVAQQLVVNGFDLYYYDKTKIGEVDFLVQKGSRAVPVEAKSGVDCAQHAALDNLLAVGEWGLQEAVVLCRENVERKGNITYLPWYAVAFLKQDALPERFVVEV
ncbi:ATP-binding protein [Rubneribacter sp.]